MFLKLYGRIFLFAALLSFISCSVNNSEDSEDKGISYAWEPDWQNNFFTNVESIPVGMVQSDQQSVLSIVNPGNTSSFLYNGQGLTIRSNTLVLQKTQTDGNLIWQKQPLTMTSGLAQGIGLSNSGSAFVFGQFLTSISGGSFSANSVAFSDGFIAEVDQEGNVQNLITIGGEGGDNITSVASAPDGGLYIAGSFSKSIQIGETVVGSDNGEFQQLILHLNSSGELVWGNVFENVSITDLSPDADGSIYITGRTIQSTATMEGSSFGGGRSGFYIAQLDTQGDLLWINSENGGGGKQVLVKENDLFVVGESNDQTFNNGQFSLKQGGLIAKYNKSNGELSWAASTEGRTFNSVAVDNEGNVYCTGRIDGIRYQDGTIRVDDNDPTPEGVFDSYFTAGALVSYTDDGERYRVKYAGKEFFGIVPFSDGMVIQSNTKTNVNNPPNGSEGRSNYVSIFKTSYTD